MRTARMELNRRPSVLVDRDGTLIVDKHYLGDPSGIEMLPNALAGLKLLRAMGVLVLSVTNQSGVGRGYFTMADAVAVNDEVSRRVFAEGGEISQWYVCPHTPDAGCDCRKPSPGLGRQAAQDWDLDPQACFVIGDKASDIGLGIALGARTILIGHSDVAQLETPDFVAPDMLAAARWIAGQMGLQS